MGKVAREGRADWTAWRGIADTAAALQFNQGREEDITLFEPHIQDQAFVVEEGYEFDPFGDDPMQEVSEMPLSLRSSERALQLTACTLQGVLEEILPEIGEEGARSRERRRSETVSDRHDRLGESTGGAAEAGDLGGEQS